MVVRYVLAIAVLMFCSTMVVAPPPPLPATCTVAAVNTAVDTLYSKLPKSHADPADKPKLKAEAIEPCIRAMMDTQDVQFNHNLDDGKLANWDSEYNTIKNNFQLLDQFTAGRDTCIVCHNTKTLADDHITDFLDKYATLKEARTAQCKQFTHDSKTSQLPDLVWAQKGCDLAVTQCATGDAGKCRPATTKGRGIYGYLGTAAAFGGHGTNIMSCKIAGAHVLDETKKFTGAAGEVSVEQVLRDTGVLINDPAPGISYLSWKPYNAMEIMFHRVGLFYGFITNAKAFANKGGFTSLDHCCIHLDASSKVVLKNFKACDHNTPKPHFAGRRVRRGALSP